MRLSGKTRCLNCLGAAVALGVVALVVLNSRDFSGTEAVARFHRPPADRKPPRLEAGRSAGDLRDEIRAALASGGDVDREKVFSRWLPEWVRRDPRSAAAFAEGRGAGAWTEEALTTVVRTWVDSDADGAMDWAAQLRNVAERDTVLAEGYWQLGKTDPGKALMLTELHGSKQGGDLQADLVMQWARSDYEAAERWVREHPTAEGASRLATVLAETSPLQAAQLVVESIPPGSVQTEAVMTVLHQWGLRDLPAARAWVAQFPEGELRQRAEQELNGIVVRGPVD